jgi:hypothetical protein
VQRAGMRERGGGTVAPEVALGEQLQLLVVSVTGDRTRCHICYRIDSMPKLAFRAGRDEEGADQSRSLAVTRTSDKDIPLDEVVRASMYSVRRSAEARDRPLGRADLG